MTRNIQSSELKMSLTNLLSVLECEVSRVSPPKMNQRGEIKSPSWLISSASAFINWNGFLNIFFSLFLFLFLDSTLWEIVSPQHKSKCASFTRGKCKQLSFISVQIICRTTQGLLLRWDFFFFSLLLWFQYHKLSSIHLIQADYERSSLLISILIQIPNKDSHPAIEHFILKSNYFSYQIQ